MRTFSIKTFGCKVNQYESDQLRERLLAQGLKEVDWKFNSDMVIVNTCTVTGRSDYKVRNSLREIKRRLPDAKVVAIGCGTRNESSGINRIKGIDTTLPDLPEADQIKIRGIKRTRAFLKIQDGCDNFCSYCIVPYVRGRSQSRSVTEVIKEFEGLIKDGFKEVVLCGVCLGSFPDLTGFLRKLVKLPGEYRIRLSSIEPWYVTDELLDFMAKEEKICPHLHLPLQSGDEEILQAMRRKITLSEYKELVDKARQRIPGIAITTDIIVGFPGETDENFENTLRTVKHIGFSGTHIFPYSERSGTVAEKIKNKVTSSIMESRKNRLTEICAKQAQQYRDNFNNKKVEVLVEAKRDTQSGFLIGYSPNYLRVSFKGEDSLKGEFVQVPC